MRSVQDSPNLWFNELHLRRHHLHSTSTYGLAVGAISGKQDWRHTCVYGRIRVRSHHKCSHFTAQSLTPKPPRASAIAIVRYALLLRRYHVTDVTWYDGQNLLFM